jgi:adenylate kinase
LINKPPKKPGICDVCGTALVQRMDDTPEVIRERLKTHRAKTEPLIGRYAAKGSLHEIDGNRRADEVNREVRRVLEALLGHPDGAGKRP